MMIRAATTDPFSLADAAAVLTGLVVVGAMVFCISMCAQDSPSISDFLHRTQSEADASRFHDLLGALDAPQQASHVLAGAERSAAHEDEAAARTGVALLASTPIKREEIKLSERSGDVGQSELQEMYRRAIAPGILKPREAARTVQPKRLDL